MFFKAGIFRHSRPDKLTTCVRDKGDQYPPLADTQDPLQPFITGIQVLSTKLIPEYELEN